MREQLLRNIEELIPVLRRYAWFLARDPDNANDLVHHCLERAVAPLDQFQVGTNLRAWLLAIMRNCFLDGKRREKGRTEVGLDDLAGEKVWSPPRQEHNLLMEELSSVFLELPDSQKLAIIFVVFEGLSYDEAADLMEVSVGTIKSRVARGREALRRAIAAEPLQQFA